jgi:3-oxoacyl-[acyl-carrier-protein] synthase-3
MNKINAAISGVFGYVPPYILTNKELEGMVDTNEEWIVSRTGIQERRILKGEDMGTSVMGIEAVKGLLEKTGTRPEDVDLLICETRACSDTAFPNCGNTRHHHRSGWQSTRTHCLRTNFGKRSSRSRKFPATI